MTTTNADRVRRYKARKRGDAAPELKRGRPAPPVVIDYDAAPAPQPRRLRKPQRVTRWNVKTGQIEERWE